MLLTSSIRWLQQEIRSTNGTTEVATRLVLQQWYDPEPLKGELVGEWRDVPVVEQMPMDKPKG